MREFDWRSYGEGVALGVVAGAITYLGAESLDWALDTLVTGRNLRNTAFVTLPISQLLGIASALTSGRQEPLNEIHLTQSEQIDPLGYIQWRVDRELKRQHEESVYARTHGTCNISPSGVEILSSSEVEMIPSPPYIDVVDLVRFHPPFHRKNGIVHESLSETEGVWVLGRGDQVRYLSPLQKSLVSTYEIHDCVYFLGMGEDSFTGEEVSYHRFSKFEDYPDKDLEAVFNGMRVPNYSVLNSDLDTVIGRMSRLASGERANRFLHQNHYLSSDTFGRECELSEPGTEFFHLGRIETMLRAALSGKLFDPVLRKVGDNCKIGIPAYLGMYEGKK